MQKLSEVTRTEVFFTSYLYHEFMREPDAFEKLLLGRLKLFDAGVKIIDSGYEICLFRDFAKAGYIDRLDKSFEKQTFDNVFVLSNKAIVLIEAKAHQKFSPGQIAKMVDAKKEIKKSKLHWNKVYLVGVCSSKYTPKPETVKGFDTVLNWKDIDQCFSEPTGVFKRADTIYND